MGSFFQSGSEVGVAKQALIVSLPKRHRWKNENSGIGCGE